jgi:hypothetical protein
MPASFIKEKTSLVILLLPDCPQNSLIGDKNMANKYQPRISDWYQSISGDRFEVVALDNDEATLEIQYFDGAVEEIDFDSWNEMEIKTIEPPEDWSGSLDIERDDYGVDLELTAPNDHINPIDDFE